eukprot:TRINITY_DN21565_c0_g1_i1.p1 TRINITY_DN21565_c0_g1~~TRINITY_DN21565_c0_g1_i1.p1  ORF type:complete len:170 (+),score=8.43 TRINITY_DN21565_c0_g1_i1:32-541(+)
MGMGGSSVGPPVVQMNSCSKVTLELSETFPNNCSLFMGAILPYQTLFYFIGYHFFLPKPESFHRLACLDPHSGPVIVALLHIGLARLGVPALEFDLSLWMLCHDLCFDRLGPGLLANPTRDACDEKQLELIDRRDVATVLAGTLQPWVSQIHMVKQTVCGAGRHPPKPW